MSEQSNSFASFIENQREASLQKSIEAEKSAKTASEKAERMLLKKRARALAHVGTSIETIFNKEEGALLEQFLEYAISQEMKGSTEISGPEPDQVPGTKRGWFGLSKYNENTQPKAWSIKGYGIGYLPNSAASGYSSPSENYSSGDVFICEDGKLRYIDYSSPLIADDLPAQINIDQLITGYRIQTFSFEKPDSEKVGGWGATPSSNKIYSSAFKSQTLEETLEYHALKASGLIS